jgi:PAS domain-containing protein
MDDFGGAAVAFVDADLRYRRCNEIYREWFGLKRYGEVGLSFHELLGEEADKLAQTHVKAALCGIKVTFEQPLSLPDGQSKHVRVTLDPMFGRDGWVDGFVALLSDASN